MSLSSPVRRHYAFFSFPGIGHVRPTLPIVHELVARGHRVTYFVADRLAHLVAGSGAEVVEYFSEFPEPVGEVRTVDETARMLIDLMREGLAPLHGALEAFAEQPPDLIVHDDNSTHTARLLAHRWNLPLVRLYPHFYTIDEPAGDPQTEQPDDGEVTAASLGAHAGLIAAGERMFADLAALGYDRETALSVLRCEDAASNLSFAPRFLQPGADEDLPDRFLCIGPSPDPVPEGSWEPPAGRAAILVSLGTSAKTSPEFFRRCALALAAEDRQVVLTVGGRVDPAEVGELPDGVEVHQWLPHALVLPHASAYVGSAGLNSFNSALRWHVPLVSVPLTLEQEATASRVDELGLGVRLDFDDVTPESVRQAVSTITSDPAYAERMRRMSETIDAENAASRAADEIEFQTPVAVR
ncbi:macrolide family glycosyltransferase [Amycolatopsis minnesotensis]|uniref:Macrolide-inactivating glycosyltransferase n=1 Tax=Amycolatopsis minnesotensis TaxID=337894 RepID=A0ABN2QH02_9PSEU